MALLAAVQVLSCTDAGLYAASGGGPSGPDRVELRGVACVPLAAGESFPVKVVYLLEGGNIDTTIKGKIVEALSATTAQFGSPYISFAFVGYRAVATGLLGSFARDSQVSQAITQYGSNGVIPTDGPVSHRAPLKLAHSIISGDMQTGCRGLVGRTRYYVVHIIVSPDTSCANPVFNPAITPKCNALLPNQAECSACELERVTEELKGLARTFNAGEVAVQPVYVTDSQDAATLYEANAIARAGGTELIVSSPANLSRTLASLNYASLQRSLVLKRLIAMNRNTRSRDGQVLVDSDGDGIPDDEETVLGTSPTLFDTDGDRLSDGVELRMGLRPQPISAGGTVDVIAGCNAESDTDGDRLNDCEERVLGTDACIADTDGDGLPDFVEHLGGTNPVVAEDLRDDERDGLNNVGEIEAHTDPLSADIAFQKERGYGYSIVPTTPTPDGRACYELDIYNVSVVGTLARPDGAGLTIPRGSNDIFVYFQVGRDNDPRGTGIGSLFISRVNFTPPATRKPRGVISFTPEQFLPGF
jgi:hypothetical protein